MQSDQLFEQASQLYEEGNFESAFGLFLKAAELGDAAAMGNLATMYGCGEGVHCDFDKAIYWDLRAAEAGNISSLLNLGITHRTKGNLKEARQWFEKSVDAGEGEAALQLAKIFMVSELEQMRVKEYLELAIISENICDSSREEAKELLKQL